MLNIWLETSLKKAKNLDYINNAIPFMRRNNKQNQLQNQNSDCMTSNHLVNDFNFHFELNI